MEKIKGFLLGDLSELKYVVTEINCWNGSLELLEVYENDEYFFEDIFYGRKYELVEKIANGDYRLGDDYVKFDCYGDIVSLNEWEWEEELEENIDEIIEKLIDCYDNLVISDELVALIEEYLEEEE